MTTIVFPVADAGKTFLGMVQAMAKNVGLPVPDLVVGSTERTWVEAVEIAQMLADDLQRRVDWGGLVTSLDITGDGTGDAVSLPGDFGRLAQGAAVTASTSPVRSLTRAEWGTLGGTEGTPRYFLLENNTLRFHPYPADGAIVSISYLSQYGSCS